MIERRQLLATMLALIAGAGVAFADELDSCSSIRLITPSGAGSAADAYTRVVANQLQQQTGKPITVENMPGAGGIIATRAIISAPGNGCVLGFTASSYVSHHVTSKEPQYQWPRDFTLVHQSVRVPEVLLVHAKTPFRTVKEIVDYAKANPGKLNAANTGIFTGTHIMIELFQSAAGIKFTQVPYKSAPAQVQSVFTGESDLMFQSPANYGPGVAAGTMRMIALAAEKRSDIVPGIPTLRELGYDITYSPWQGFALPKSASPAVVARWYREIDRAHASPTVMKIVNDQKLALLSGSREDMERRVIEEIKKLDALIREANLQLQ